VNRRIFALAGISAALLFSACGRQDSPREFADRFIAAENKAWASGSVEDLKALEDSGVVYHLPGQDLTGWKAHEDFIVNGRPTVTDLKQDWKYLSGEGNHIVLAYTSSAVLKGNDKTPPQATSNNYLFVFRLKDGKVAEVWANGSMATAPVHP
jgi:ketosteroid isomerase-like protein